MNDNQEAANFEFEVQTIYSFANTSNDDLGGTWETGVTVSSSMIF